MKQMKRAEQYHHYHVLSFGWSVLYEPYRQLKVKESAVHAQRQWNLLKSCWCQWLQLLDMVQARDERRFAFARTHYYAVLKVKMLARWQEGARVLKLERRAHLIGCKRSGLNQMRCGNWMTPSELRALCH